MLVFHELASLADSLDRSSASSAEPVTAPAPAEVVTDEERSRYGRLLDSAAERGLLDPAEYEIRLRELAEATSTARMVEIVTELPVFAAPAPTTTRPRRNAAPAGRESPGLGGQHRRATVWVVLAVLIVVAVASLIILALSAERLSRNHSSGPPPRPAATRPVSALRL
jgi:hypothetical protein